MSEYKFVAVLNKKIETGKVMNALAHMTVGLVGNYENKDNLGVMDYKDKDGGSHFASKHPFIILKAKNSNQIRTIRNSAIDKNISVTSFTSAMTMGDYKEQLDRSKATSEEELEYYGACLFGKKEEIDILTSKLSLWI